MGLLFVDMPLILDILCFISFGTMLAVVIGLLPAFAWADTVINQTNIKTDKITEWFWFAITACAIIGSYVLAFAVLAGWIK